MRPRSRSTPGSWRSPAGPLKPRVRYRDVLEQWSELGLPWDIALTAIDMATLLGPDGQGVAAAAKTATEILARLGAGSMLERLSRAMGWPDAAAATAPTPARRTTAGESIARAVAGAVARRYDPSRRPDRALLSSAAERCRSG